jgi:hypothetical protein
MTDRTLPLMADDLIDMLNDIYKERCPDPEWSERR